MKRRTIFIGLDGATFSILDPFMDQGIMPNLAGIVRKGVKAELATIIPPLTPPAWTSLVTGKRPGSHGIFDFFLKEKDGHNLRFATAKDIQNETIWSMANRHGLKTTVLNFPLMMPPPSLDGNVIAGGWMTPRQLRIGCSPERIFDSLKEQPWFSANDITMEMSHEIKALEGCNSDEYEDWISFHTRRETQWTNITKFLMDTDPNDLTAVMFDGVDKIQHLCWRFFMPDLTVDELAPWEKRIRAACLDYFAELDHLIGEIQEAAGEDATIIFASDHGFCAQTDTFFVNSWLAQHGYLKWAIDQHPEQGDTSTFGMSSVARHAFTLDWNATRAYASMPSSNGIFIVPASENTPNGVPETEYAAFRDRLIKDLLALKHPDTGRPVVTKIWTKEEAFDGPMKPYAPDLTLRLHDNGNFSILSSDEVVKPRKAIMGTHHPRGIFIAKGPKYKENVVLEPLHILDVAPVILNSLELPIPQDLEGTLPEMLFTKKQHQENEVGIVYYEKPVAQEPETDTKADCSVFDAEAEAEMASRLRALGYIE